MSRKPPGALIDDLRVRLRRHRRERERLLALLAEAGNTNEQRAAKLAEDIRGVEIDVGYLENWLEAQTEDAAA